jgi:hypothetical protein
MELSLAQRKANASSLYREAVYSNTIYRDIKSPWGQTWFLVFSADAGGPCLANGATRRL